MPLLTSIRSILRTQGFAGLIAHAYRRVHPYRSGFLKDGKSQFEGKTGLEIGGPSGMFMRIGAMPVYPLAARIDNCNYGQRTTWEGAIEVGPTFCFEEARAPGNQYVCEAIDLGGIPSSNYDFVLSSHMLEHSANPLKALVEWVRVLKDEGILVLALPHRDGTFDHRRPVTTLAHLIEDFEHGVDEYDLTHLEEIMCLHDLSKDPDAGDHQSFAKRSRRNFENRCLHHHVFDTRLAVDLVDHKALQIISVEVFRPHDILLIARKPKAVQLPNNQRFKTPEAIAAWCSPFPTDRKINT